MFNDGAGDAASKLPYEREENRELVKGDRYLVSIQYKDREINLDGELVVEGINSVIIFHFWIFKFFDFSSQQSLRRGEVRLSLTAFFY